MELTPHLEDTLKTLRLHPLIQRRELMFAIALAADSSMSEAERAHDTTHADLLASTRRQYIEALQEKGLAPSEAEAIATHIASKNSEVSALTLELATTLSMLSRTARMRDALPVHMRSVPSFSTPDRVGDKMAQMLGDQEKNYIAMMRCLAPSNYRREGFVIGTYTRSDVELDIVGKDSQGEAARLKEMLATLKNELGIDGLHISARDGQSSRGMVLSCKVTVEASVIKALAEAYGREPERFKAVAQQAARPSRAIG